MHLVSSLEDGAGFIIDVGGIGTRGYEEERSADSSFATSYIIEVFATASRHDNRFFGSTSVRERMNELINGGDDDKISGFSSIVSSLNGDAEGEIILTRVWPNAHTSAIVKDVRMRMRRHPNRNIPFV
jgi:hypothetical protein